MLYNIPPDARGSPKAVEPDLPAGTREGKNDWKRTGYGGPCPPIGRHRYFFKLYALDTTLPDLKQPTKSRARKGDARATSSRTAELIGTYQKTAPRSSGTARVCSPLPGKSEMARECPSSYWYHFRKLLFVT